MEKLLFCSTET